MTDKPTPTSRIESHELLEKKALHALELAKEASEGPWHIGHVVETHLERSDVDSGDGCLVAEVEWIRDQNFICISRTLLPELASGILEQQKEIERLREALKQISYPWPIDVDRSEILKIRVKVAREALQPMKNERE